MTKIICMKKNKIILIGAIDKGKIPTNGETVKNQLLVERFEDLFDKVIAVDTFHWEKRPWCIFQILWNLAINSGASVVVSASGGASFLYDFLYYFPLKKNVFDWVIGGSRATRIREGRYRIKSLKRLKKIIVEGFSMVRELNGLGLDNVIRVPNFKPIDYSATIRPKKADDVYRFVFLSRMHPSKGVKEIIEACNLLNQNGYNNRYVVDFYGPFDTQFEDEFYRMIEGHKNISYNGFLNMRNTTGYDTLSSYDAMLFPTYWDGEGFPGVVLDANMAGLPIIASDWNMNKEVIIDNETGFIIPVHDNIALYERMKLFMENKVDLYEMKQNCVNYVKQFDYRNVITKELLIKIGIIK